MSENPIVQAIEELELNGLATRPWSEAGKLLALCEKCIDFTPRVGCAVRGRTPTLYSRFLCNATRTCPRWDKLRGGPPVLADEQPVF